MYPTASSPQYAFGSGLAPVPMPVYKRGGEVKETYGLDNIAEMIRQRGREGDTVLAHISPQEAGILQLLGGSGTINPYTGLPEFKILKKIVPKPIYKLGSAIGKGIERGIESIAQKLGPVGQIAATYFGGPIGAALYAGLAPKGSSFDVKRAAVAGALAYGAGQLQGMGGAEAGTGAGADLASQQAIDAGINIAGSPESYYQAFDAGIDIASAPSMYPSVNQAVSMSGPGAFEGAASDSATSYLNAPVEPITYTPDPSSYVSGADSAGTYAGTPTATDAYSTASTAPTSPYDAGQGLEVMNTNASPELDPYGVDNSYNVSQDQILRDTRNPLSQGYDAAKQGYADVKQGIKDLIPKPIQEAYGTASNYVKDLVPPEYREILSTAKDVALIGSGAATAYGMYQTKKELDAAKAEADRIMADRENRKKEEIEWAQGVMRDYPYNYQRLTEEEVRRERGMAMGGRITSYDDEMGRDDGMMQGGIAALAKGGLPPRYLRGGGDGMSDSIRASIEGKQEARLADGEFVVPADVVSHLGNGSSNAGAKKLYSMMDRVRKSRTGKTRQAPEVNTRRLMPA
jgi:hypothetical protein